MDPDLVTDPKLGDVLRELIAREPIFHRPEPGTRHSDKGGRELLAHTLELLGAAPD